MSTTTPLLTTKLYIPRVRPSLVSRPRLTAQLAEGLTRGLTLVSAPPGFGKTTLISEWISDFRSERDEIRSTQAPAGNPKSSIDNRTSLIAWLSLDHGDNDPILFWTYFITALQRLDARWGEDALALIHTPAPQPPSFESILTLLLNDIVAFPHVFTFVLDDYHVIDSRPLHDGLIFLIDHLPPHMHLIIVTRADPPLPLSRLRARGQLTEIRAADLRFTPEEAAAFLNQVMGLNLTAQDIATLETRTEGWIAGLQLAALSMQGHTDFATFIHNFAGSHHYIVDYLAEEVLRRQPLDVQEFLLHTGILDRLSGPLCEAVSGQTDAQLRLEQMERINLFLIALDNDRNWYRYHHLFAEVLRRRLQETQPERVDELHRRASIWYEQNRLVGEAVQHALAAHDATRAARLIEDAAEGLFNRGEHTTIQLWLDALPEEVIRARARLALFRARTLVIASQLDSAEKWLRDSEHAEQAGPAEGNPNNILSEVMVLRAQIAQYRNDLPSALELLQQALAQTPESNLRLRGEVMQHLGGVYAMSGDLDQGSRNLTEAVRLAEAADDMYTALYAMFNSGAVLNMQGRLRQATDAYLRCVELARQRGVGRMPITALLHRDLAEIYYQWNDLESATSHAQEAVAISERGALTRVLVVSYIPLAYILNAQGDQPGALETMMKAEQLIIKHNLPMRHADMVTACKVHLWLIQNDLVSAGDWAHSCGLSADDELDYLHEAIRTSLVRVWIVQGEFEQATKLLKRLRDLAQQQGRMADVIKLMTVEIMLLQEVESTSASPAVYTLLEQTLLLAGPENYIRCFVDEGEPMRSLIINVRRRVLERSAAQRQAEDAALISYIDRLLSSFPASASANSKSEIIGWVEGLTEREMEVLRLVQAGLSDRQIAGELIISIGTVKRHLNNIYSKFQVHSRTAALMRAKEIGLL